MIAKVDRKYNYTFSNATNKYVICERRNLEVSGPPGISSHLTDGTMLQAALSK